MSKRPVKAINIAGVEPAATEAGPPRFEWIDPATLLVDDAYQRGLSEKSVSLVRKIVGGWDWSKFKPPVCALTDDGLEVIDGQHTAIAAASHPMVATIPVMIVEADSQAGRAKAFVGHNRDRINLTLGQMHYAALAAGDEDAQTIAQVCERASVRVLRGPPPNGVYQPGDTVAVKAIGALINRRGAMGARVILQALSEAKCAPVGAQFIKAAEMLMHDAEYKGQVEPDGITTALRLMGPEVIEQEAKVFAAAHNVPIWRGMVVVLFRKAKARGRRAAA